MGWSSWNHFAETVTDSDVRAASGFHDRRWPARPGSYQYAIIKDLGLLRSTYIVITPLGGVVGCGCVPQPAGHRTRRTGGCTIRPACWMPLGRGIIWLVHVPPSGARSISFQMDFCASTETPTSGETLVLQPNLFTRRPMLAFAVLIAVNAMWAFQFSGARIATRELGPVLVTLVPLALATFLVMPFAKLNGGSP